MDGYTKAIMDILKDNYIRVVGVKAFQNTSEAREFYLELLEDNLYCPMSDKAKAAYGQGTGNEITSGKMNALRSSSALTYNMFWNQIAELVNTKDSVLGNGVYQVELEKQYHTLRADVSRFPANLDAFLYCDQTKEAIACEMKMTEWLFNKPGTLKAAYLIPTNYIEEDAGRVFVSVAQNLIQQSEGELLRNEKGEYLSSTCRYDAFQMFKHAVGCYTACVLEEPREIKKLTLVNCVWILPNSNILKAKFQGKYGVEKETELAEFEQCKKIMNPIKDLFACKNIDFDICFYTFSEFLQLFKKTDAELQYLRRYTLL